MANKYKNKRWRNHHSNPVFKNLEQPSVLWGRHAVIAALHNPQRILKRVFCSENNRSTLHEEISKISNAGASSVPELEVLPIRELSLLVPSDSVHQGFVTISEALTEPDFDGFLEKNKTELIFSRSAIPSTILLNFLKSSASWALVIVLSSPTKGERGFNVILINLSMS